MRLSNCSFSKSSASGKHSKSGFTSSASKKCPGSVKSSLKKCSYSTPFTVPSWLITQLNAKSFNNSGSSPLEQNHLPSKISEPNKKRKKITSLLVSSTSLNSCTKTPTWALRKSSKTSKTKSQAIPPSKNSLKKTTEAIKTPNSLTKKRKSLLTSDFPLTFRMDIGQWSDWSSCDFWDSLICWTFL